MFVVTQVPLNSPPIEKSGSFTTSPPAARSLFSGMCTVKVTMRTTRYAAAADATHRAVSRRPDSVSRQQILAPDSLGCQIFWRLLATGAATFTESPQISPRDVAPARLCGGSALRVAIHLAARRCVQEPAGTVPRSVQPPWEGSPPLKAWTVVRPSGSWTR